MPIDLRQITTGQTGTGTRRAENTSESSNARKDNGSANASVQQDSVELSGKSQLVKSLLSEIASRPEVNSSRVEQIKNSIASGNFSVSADKIATKMMALDNGLRKLS